MSQLRFSDLGNGECFRVLDKEPDGIEWKKLNSDGAIDLDGIIVNAVPFEADLAVVRFGGPGL